MEPTSQSNLFELQIDHNAMQYLKDAARWGKFLAVIGFIFCGLIILVAIVVAAAGASLFSSLGSGGSALGGGLLATFYILVGLLYFFPCLYLYNFAARMQVALRGNDQDQLNISFRNLRALYRFLGILTVIYLGLVVLALLVTIIASAMR